MDLAYRPWRDGFAMRLFAIGRHDPGSYHEGCLAGLGVDQRDPANDRRLVDYRIAALIVEFVTGGRFRSLTRRPLAARLTALERDWPSGGWRSEAVSESCRLALQLVLDRMCARRADA